MIPLITTCLDTDLYKLTMMQCVFHRFPKARARYRYKQRKAIVTTSACLSFIEAQIDAFCTLRWQPEELGYLATLPYFREDFLTYLTHFRFNRETIHIEVKNGLLDLFIEGPWLDTILFEVPLLAIISEVFSQHYYPHVSLQEAQVRLDDKISYVQKHCPAMRFCDFGTRRRFSKKWHSDMLACLKDKLPDQCVGTSNISLAKHYGLPPLGTMGHEYLQACQVLSPSLAHFQSFALHTWLTEYPHATKVALTDVITTESFLKSFDKTLAERYHGLRQDSGNPFLWARQILHHYETLGIDARSKILVFSDSLNFPFAAQIYYAICNQCMPLFGIGTHLTNDVGSPPFDIVIKMTHLNQEPVVKISDSPGKLICEDEKILPTFRRLFSL